MSAWKQSTGIHSIILQEEPCISVIAIGIARFLKTTSLDESFHSNHTQLYRRNIMSIQQSMPSHQLTILGITKANAKIGMQTI